MAKRIILPPSFYKRPLTEEERAFAEEHLGVVRYFANQKKYYDDDWYAILIEGYLLSVKKWFTLPALHKYSFFTIAAMDMRCKISCELKKRKKEPFTVSLYEPVKGTDNLYYIDKICADVPEYFKGEDS